MYSRHVDSHTCTDHIEIQTHHWLIQMDHLVDAYLEYPVCDSHDSMPTTVPASPVSTNEGCTLVDIKLVVS